jgi:hypothetical protein
VVVAELAQGDAAQAVPARRLVPRALHLLGALGAVLVGRVDPQLAGGAAVLVLVAHPAQRQALSSEGTLELLWTAGLVLDALERFVAGVFAVALGVATPVGRDALAAVALELVVAAGGCTQKKNTFNIFVSEQIRLSV